MLKLSGAFLVVMFFIFMGEKVAGKKRERLCFIENMLFSLADFKTAIGLFSLPVPEAIEKSGVEAVLKRAEEKGILKEDASDFSVFISGTKAETLEGQMRNIEVYEKKLASEEEAERLEYKKTSKLIKGGFSLLGLFTVIMLL